MINEDCLEESYADIVPSKTRKNFFVDLKKGIRGFLDEDIEENEAKVIERLSRCFMSRYSDCPAFFMGSLKDACQKAFDDNRIKEVSFNSIENFHFLFFFSIPQC